MFHSWPRKVYLRVWSLLDGLQRELDTSWAVMGEVYSRREDLKGLGIRLRRVRSNLDDVRRFRQQVSYIPGRFAFESAGTGLLKKLVAPLYGDAPEVGVRELLQNAIDAVGGKSGVEIRCRNPGRVDLGGCPGPPHQNRWTGTNG